MTTCMSSFIPKHCTLQGTSLRRTLTLRGIHHIRPQLAWGSMTERNQLLLLMHPSRAGAALFQNNRSIAFKSKVLVPAETRYVNIDRELLAVVYGCEKFYSYLYGRSLVVKTDHRPLKQIHEKILMRRLRAFKENCCA